MHKYKLGQKVLLAPLALDKDRKDRIWIPEFNRKIGKVFTIASIRKDDYNGVVLVTFEEDTIPWSYDIRWIKPVSKRNNPIKKHGQIVDLFSKYGV